MDAMVTLLHEYGVKIYENTKVLKVKKHKVITNKGAVRVMVPDLMRKGSCWIIRRR